MRARRWTTRIVAVAAVLGATALALASTGNGNVVFSPHVDVILVSAGAGTGTATLQNTTTSSYNVSVGSDVSCDPAVSFAVSGANPFVLAGTQMKSVSLGCVAGHAPGLQRCLLHATDTTNGSGLDDVLAVCEYASIPTLGPSSALLDFGDVAVGDAPVMTLDLTNNSPTSVKRLFLQTTDLDGNFTFSTPCNPDAPYCDANVAPVGMGGSTTVMIKCTPQTPGLHVANLVVATDTSQYLSQTVQLQCNGTAATTPVLGVSPATVDIRTPIEVMSGTASAVVHLSNTGSGTLLVSDVRPVDVDNGAAMDWTYTASAPCTSAIPPTCILTHGEQVDIRLTFDPSTLGTRRASLLVSYHDTLDRTKSIPLAGVGQGATLGIAGGQTVLDLGTVPLNHTASLDIQLANHGNRDTTAMLSMMPTMGPFTLTPSTSAVVTPTALESVTVSCTPTAVGMASTTITAQSDDVLAGSPTVLTATCEGTTDNLFASPGAVSLGEVRIGDPPITKTFQLMSASSGLTLAGQPALELPNAGLMVGSASPLTTPTSFDLTIEPLAEGDILDHVIATDTDGETVRIPIAGHVVTATYVAPPMLDVGTFCINQPTTSSNLSLSSSGTATLGLQAPTLDPGSPFDMTFTSPTIYPSALSTNQSATVSLTPQRRSAAATESDVLTWHTDVAGKLTATTTITAKFIDSGAAIAPPALDFGKVLIHIYADDGQRVMIQNCNGTALELIPPVLKLPFSIDSPNFPSLLNPGETATFSVGFHPTKLGPVSDTLTISSPQLPNTPLQVALFGEGVAEGGSGDDAGSGSGSAALDQSSFYACSCTSASPGGGLPIALTIGWAIGRRRRRRS